MTVLILGGVRSGKSGLGQQTALKLSSGQHYYIATMIPTDADDHERIRLHLLDREGMGFQTIEQGREVQQQLIIYFFFDRSHSLGNLSNGCTAQHLDNFLQTLLAQIVIPHTVNLFHQASQT